MRFVLDESGHGGTVLGVCACGWRGLPTRSKTGQYTQLVAHERACHPRDFQVRRTVYNRGI